MLLAVDGAEAGRIDEGLDSFDVEFIKEQLADWLPKAGVGAGGALGL